MGEISQLSLCEVILRIVVAAVIGVVFGIEREDKRKPAGSRTYVYVCLGSCLVMLINENLTYLYQSGDPARLGAQVISGIGFLGAGTILVTRDNQVRGLTTAAGLWLIACIGLAIGSGFYAGGLSIAVVMYFALVFGRRVNEFVHRHSRYLHIYISFYSIEELTNFLNNSQEKDVQISDMQILKDKKEAGASVAAMMTIKMPDSMERKEWLLDCSREKGVAFLEEI